MAIRRPSPLAKFLRISTGTLYPQSIAPCSSRSFRARKRRLPVTTLKLLPSGSTTRFWRTPSVLMLSARLAIFAWSMKRRGLSFGGQSADSGIVLSVIADSLVLNTACRLREYATHRQAVLWLMWREAQIGGARL